MKRLFFGIPLPQSLATEIQQRVKGVQLPGGSRLISPQNYHLTLLFLGDCGTEDFSRAQQGGREAAHVHKPFEIRFQDWGAFPSARRPRILFVGLEDPKHCMTSLNQSLVTTLGLSQDKPFKPHLTVARMEPSRPLGAMPQPPRLSMDVTSFTLFSSQLTPRGPIYTQEEVFSLEHLVKGE